MPVLQKFMCCCQLRTGAVVIGWVGLVLEVISIAADSAFLSMVDSIQSEMDAMVKIPVSISLASAVISVIAHILLIWGANAKKRFLLLPWLISTMMIIVISFLTVLIVGIILAENHADGGPVALLFITGFSITGIILYLWLCILSLFQEFHEKGEDGITLTPADYNSPPYAALQESC